MSKAVLMPDNEPTDEQLSALMKEVAAEAKEKAEKAKLALLEKVSTLVNDRKKKLQNEK